SVIGVLVLCAIFGLTFFAVKKGKEAVVELADQADDMHAKMRREAEERNRKAQQDAEERNRKAQEDADKRQKEFLEKLNKPKKDPKIVPNLGPLQRVPGTNLGDLLTIIDPQKDGGGRRWEMVNNQLHCKEGNFRPRLEIPYIPPQEYDFIVQFSQPKLRNGIS